MHPEGEEVSETEEARVRRYVEALPDEWSASTYEDAARAVIAIANEEQAALRADRNVAYGMLTSAQHRAEAAEAEVERLTRECLDRATEIDARERLRQAEERLAKREEWLEILDRAAGFGSLADVAAHQRELGVEGDHETRLRQKRVDLLRDLIATAAAQEADSASWQAADD